MKTQWVAIGTINFIVCLLLSFHLLFQTKTNETPEVEDSKFIYSADGKVKVKCIKTYPDGNPFVIGTVTQAQAIAISGKFVQHKLFLVGGTIETNSCSVDRWNNQYQSYYYDYGVEHE